MITRVVKQVQKYKIVSSKLRFCGCEANIPIVWSEEQFVETMDKCEAELAEATKEWESRCSPYDYSKPQLKIWWENIEENY
jgi:hypothetical protein